MNWKVLFAGVGIGIMLGALVGQSQNQTSISSELALKIAKRAFKEQGSIDGSWIHMKKEIIKKFNLSYNVYRGGITRTVNNQVEQFEFLIDSKTGAILDVQPI